MSILGNLTKAELDCLSVLQHLNTIATSIHSVKKDLEDHLNYYINQVAKSILMLDRLNGEPIKSIENNNFVYEQSSINLLLERYQQFYQVLKKAEASQNADEKSTESKTTNLLCLNNLYGLADLFFDCANQKTKELNIDSNLTTKFRNENRFNDPKGSLLVTDDENAIDEQERKIEKTVSPQALPKYINVPKYSSILPYRNGFLVCEIKKEGLAITYYNKDKKLPLKSVSIGKDIHEIKAIDTLQFILIPDLSPGLLSWEEKYFEWLIINSNHSVNYITNDELLYQVSIEKSPYLHNLKKMIYLGGFGLWQNDDELSFLLVNKFALKYTLFYPDKLKNFTDSNPFKLEFPIKRSEDMAELKVLNCISIAEDQLICYIKQKLTNKDSFTSIFFFQLKLESSINFINRYELRLERPLTGLCALTLNQFVLTFYDNIKQELELQTFQTQNTQTLEIESEFLTIPLRLQQRLVIKCKQPKLESLVFENAMLAILMSGGSDYKENQKTLLIIHLKTEQCARFTVTTSATNLMVSQEYLLLHLINTNNVSSEQVFQLNLKTLANVFQLQKEPVFLQELLNELFLNPIAEIIANYVHNDILYDPYETFLNKPHRGIEFAKPSSDLKCKNLQDEKQFIGSFAFQSEFENDLYYQSALKLLDFNDETKPEQVKYNRIKGFENLLKLANVDYPPAFYQLGKYYLQTIGIELYQDEIPALELKQSTETKYQLVDSPAQSIGFFHKFKNSVPPAENRQDFESKQRKAAFDCFKKAAEQNYLPALFALGYCIEQEIGIEKNPHEALDLYSKASARSLLHKP